MKHDVLIADDDEHLRELLKLMFQDSFRLQFAENAKEALKLISENKFQILVLDIHMPDQTGLDVCRELNTYPVENRPQIVILSADSDDAVVKEAYELGAGDYITKPFNVTAFHERMLRLSRDLEKIKALEAQDQNIQSMTETVMKQAASYGNALELVSRLNKCTTVEKLAEEVLQNFLTQGFHCALQLRIAGKVMSYDVDEDSCSDIELQIFDLLKGMGRIYNFGKRCIFNDEHVSILVKNMPAAATKSYDAMLDVAAKLIPAINSRFVAICEHQSLLETREQLGTAMAMLSEGVTEMETEKRQLMENIELQIGMSFHQLDMDENQEAFFLNMIEKEIRSREESSKLDRIQDMIGDCISALDVVEDDIHEDAEQDSADEDKGEDIELF